jgi:hypothetical protein
MALMFSRLARNFVKAGFFPTDKPTLEKALRLFRRHRAKSYRVGGPDAASVFPG